MEVSPGSLVTGRVGFLPRTQMEDISYFASIPCRYGITCIERRFSKGFSEGQYGRLRDVVEGPGGALYFLTSNRDGRAIPCQATIRLTVSFRNERSSLSST